MSFEAVQDLWWVIALYVSFGMALSANLNNKFQLDGLRLKIIIASVCGLSLTPFFFFVSLPYDPYFYFSMVCAAILLSINETRALDMSAQYGGPFTTLARPLIIIITFILWAIITFEETLIMLINPYVSIGIFISFLCVMSGSISISRYSDFAKKGLKALIEIAVLGALIAILIKLGMDYADSLMQVFLWTCMLNILIAISAFIRWFFKKDRKPITKSYLKCGAILGTINTCIAPGTTAAVALAPNPAFASVVFMMCTIWLAIYYKIIGQDANMSLNSAILIVTGVCLLTLTTNL